MQIKIEHADPASSNVAVVEVVRDRAKEPERHELTTGKFVIVDGDCFMKITSMSQAEKVTREAEAVAKAKVNEAEVQARRQHDAEERGKLQAEARGQATVITTADEPEPKPIDLTKLPEPEAQKPAEPPVPIPIDRPPVSNEPAKQPEPA